MARFSTPIVLIALVAGLAAGCSSGALGAPAASTSANAVSPDRLTLAFTISGGPGEGSYASDPASTLATCSHAADGSWRLLYAGGTPWVNVDLLFGAKIATPAGAGDVAAEIAAGPAYLWMDQPKFRGGDATGRSSATVAVTTNAATITFHLTGSTPQRTPDGDGEPHDVDLTATCPA